MTCFAGNVFEKFRFVIKRYSHLHFGFLRIHTPRFIIDWINSVQDGKEFQNTGTQIWIRACQMLQSLQFIVTVCFVVQFRMDRWNITFRSLSVSMVNMHWILKLFTLTGRRNCDYRQTLFNCILNFNKSDERQANFDRSGWLIGGRAYKMHESIKYIRTPYIRTIQNI